MNSNWRRDSRENLAKKSRTQIELFVRQATLAIASPIHLLRYCAVPHACFAENKKPDALG
jgi:hypothetical protein